MRRKTLSLILFMFVIAIVCSCKTTEDESVQESNNQGGDKQETMSQIYVDEIQKENDELVTKEWLLENFDVSEQELNEIDLELIFTYEPWYVSSTHFTNDSYLLPTLRYDELRIRERLASQKWIEENSLTPLIEASPCEGKLPDIRDLKWIFLESGYQHRANGPTETDVMGHDSFVVDVKNGEILYSFTSFQLSYDHRAAREVHELTEQEKASVLEAFSDANVQTWRTCLPSEAIWYFGLQYEDGSTYTYYLDKLREQPYDFATKLISYSENPEIPYRPLEGRIIPGER